MVGFLCNHPNHSLFGSTKRLVLCADSCLWNYLRDIFNISNGARSPCSHSCHCSVHHIERRTRDMASFPVIRKTNATSSHPSLQLSTHPIDPINWHDVSITQSSLMLHGHFVCLPACLCCDCCAREIRPLNGGTHPVGQRTNEKEAVQQLAAQQWHCYDDMMVISRQG